MEIKRIPPTSECSPNVVTVLEPKSSGVYLFRTGRHSSYSEFIVIWNGDVATSYATYVSLDPYRNSIAGQTKELDYWEGVYVGEVTLSVVDDSLPPV